MKYKTLFIIGILLFNTCGTAFAEGSKAEIECKDLKPDFEKMYTDWEQKVINKDVTLTSSEFDNQFSAAQDVYHGYVGCLFGFAESMILKSKASSSGGTIMASTPNFDWLDPKAACLSQKEIKDIIGETSANLFVPILLDTHKEYSRHLKKLLNAYGNLGAENTEGTSSALQELSLRSETLTGGSRRVEEELENSFVAMDMTFSAMKELRLMFVMHVQFSCLMNNLEKYRKVLEDIRTLLTPLPKLLKNASTT